jgi:hypothetical protein
VGLGNVLVSRGSRSLLARCPNAELRLVRTGTNPVVVSPKPNTTQQFLRHVELPFRGASYQLWALLAQAKLNAIRYTAIAEHMATRTGVGRNFGDVPSSARPSICNSFYYGPEAQRQLTRCFKSAIFPRDTAIMIFPIYVPSAHRPLCSESDTAKRSAPQPCISALFLHTSARGCRHFLSPRRKSLTSPHYPGLIGPDPRRANQVT